MKSTQINTFDNLSYPFNVQYVMVAKTVRLAYCDLGASDTVVVFVHGLGAYLPTWENNLNALAEKFRCIAYDLPGYGKSDKDYYNADIQFYAENLLEFLDELNLEKVFLAGHSMGGEIGMRAAVLAPDRIKGLILSAPSGIETFSDGQREDFNLNMSKRIIRSSGFQQISLGLKKNFYKEPKGVNKMIADRMAMIDMDLFDQYCHNVASGVAAVYNKSNIEELNQVKTPTLILFGENDQLIPNQGINPDQNTLEIARAAQENIKNSQLIMIPECGHMLHYEKFKEFNSALIEFIS